MFVRPKLTTQRHISSWVVREPATKATKAKRKAQKHARRKNRGK